MRAPLQVTEQMLKGLGITKCCEIQEKRAILFRLFKPSSAEFFLRASLGIWSPTSGEDSRCVRPAVAVHASSLALQQKAT